MNERQRSFRWSTVVSAACLPFASVRIGQVAVVSFDSAMIQHKTKISKHFVDFNFSLTYRTKQHLRTNGSCHVVTSAYDLTKCQMCDGLAVNSLVDSFQKWTAHNSGHIAKSPFDLAGHGQAGILPPPVKSHCQLSDIQSVTSGNGMISIIQINTTSGNGISSTYS